MVQPIWQVLTDLGIEGEYCGNAVDAVERVTTQLFQIVITDWEDQPEAAFLLKTARDLKAAQRPLTLAIVSDDARPEALRAGANSVLLKPIRADQVRDTMSTACELLRAKQPSPAPQLPVVPEQPYAAQPTAMAATASAGAASSPAPAPVPVTEKTFRAGEFLQSSSSAPGAQFDTECDVQKSLDQAAAAEVDALTELEPMAAAVVEEPAAEPVEPLTGWAALQARLTKSAPPTTATPSTQSELLSYEETTSYGAQATPAEATATVRKESQASEEAALFSYISGESKGDADPAQKTQPRRSTLLLATILAVACAVLVAVPRTRQSLRIVYRNAVHAGGSWLNPQPVPVPQAATQHETFGQDSDDYKLPVAANIPDATTDPSQIRVLPVIDPTAKPAKGSETGGAPVPAGDNVSADPNQSGSTEGQTQAVENAVKEQVPASAGDLAGGTTVAPPSVSSSAGPAQTNPAAPPAAAVQQPPRPIAAPVQIAAAPHVVSGGSSSAIPSSLRSQTASMTPEASGAKPLEAAMSSIEPVKLPESAAWDLLAQPVDPVYPDAAKVAGQRGSVVLQVLIGRDGTVQDVKFLQGSLVFARAAIDAVKQWRFKPYSLNGRAVSVQSVITLNFKPPA